MRGHGPSYVGGRTSYQRHLRNRSEEMRAWPVVDEAITEDQIDAEREKEGPTLELSLRSTFVTLRHLSAIVKEYRAKMKRKIEYYDCLTLLRDAIEIPAMRAFMEGKFTTLRAAFLQQLRSAGIEVTETDAL